ncbi:MAG: segregation and condensation protein [Actinomycetota bacterium]|jgi:segregation and condensation protein B
MARVTDGDIAPEIVQAMEAILLVAMEPVSVKLMAQVLEQPTSVVEVLCNRLAAAYDEAGHGFQLVQVAGGFRLQSRAEVSQYVERFILDGQQARISPAALETLAIIAYKQPISRSQISAIRGVDPESVLRTLQARGYITEVQREDGGGLALLYGTTPLFLERLGLNSLENLPPISDFVPDAGVVEALEAGLRVVPDTTP